MMVDYALDAERHRGLNARDAILLAARLRARPITMTTPGHPGEAATFAQAPPVEVESTATPKRRGCARQKPLPPLRWTFAMNGT
ncbi:hypothetical protein [Bradyrhizobium sp. WSM3983]|uniref:hypothetical protein n=1 Tax=Bradyrhizobium sp. WSM3983 TaxID=1038867 RepID=UPI000408B1A1